MKKKNKKNKKSLFRGFPKSSQWEQFFNVLSSKEKLVFFLFVLLFVVSYGFLLNSFYFKLTDVSADWGGEIKEGVAGQPRFINPIYLSDNDPDRDLVEVLFSGLVKYDQQGKIVKDLAEDFEIINQAKDYYFKLKDNLLWHDREELTTDDIVFTLELVQSPQYKSPLRIEWLGVNVERLNRQEIVFHLQKPYRSFLETIAHLKILPKHIFQDVAPENFPWILTSEEYLIGSGPFQIEQIAKDKSGSIEKIILKRNEQFHHEPAYLKRISFLFFQDAEAVLKAGRAGAIDNFSSADPKYLKVLEKTGFNLEKIALPRYFALFFNLRGSQALTKEIRQAIEYSIDKNEILDKVFLNQGAVVNSPLLDDYYQLVEPLSTAEFDPEKAEQIFAQQGFLKNPETGLMEKPGQAPVSFTKELKQSSQNSEVTALQECLARDSEVYPDGTVSGYFGPKTKAAVIKFQEKYAEEILEPIGLTKGTGKVGGMTRDALNEICYQGPRETTVLKLNLTTSDKFPLIDIAENLKEQLKRIGIELEIEQASLADFQTKILTERDFEVLLFGEALGQLADPFPFWHSSQKDYPGLNIAGYNSKNADKFLEQARETSDEQLARQSLEQFQETVINDLPAIFLVQPNYFYFLSPKIKGFGAEKITEASKRLSNIEEWYIKTKRIWLR